MLISELMEYLGEIQGRCGDIKVHAMVNGKGAEVVGAVDVPATYLNKLNREVFTTTEAVILT
ncbi:hypothetical protein GUH47_26045 [Xanthomonas citri pv. citri]|nr:hypothetical protein ART_00076 [Achromobacter phage vB_Ade_ART]MBD4209376.1 hypothetical protein [Xanthomonas citri pv. citri]